MIPDWIVLLPPIIVFVLAFATQRIQLSLFLGIISATLIATNFSSIESIKMTLTTIWNTTELENITSMEKILASDNLLMFMFLLILGIIIVLLNHTGSANAYRNYIQKKISNKKEAEKSSLILSFFFFLDDYFSSVTVGSVMHPMTDKFKIPRAKLAFLVNSIAAPLCVLVPISSWSAAIMMNMHNSGISDITQNKPTILVDTFYLYLGVIPFIFYAIIMIVSTWFIVIKRISYGKMKKHETIADETGNLFAGKTAVIKKTNNSNNNNKSILNFLLPLSTLILSVFVLIFFTGNHWIFGGTNNFVDALKNSNAIQSLFFGGIITLITSFPFFMLKQKLQKKEITPICVEGIKLLGPSIIVLVLAWSLATLLRSELNTGNYLANLLVGRINIQLLPLMFFIITSITSVGIGSGWGSMAIMIPIAVQMLASLSGMAAPITPGQLPIIYPLLGAIFSGAVTGNHISPASDTMVMSATSAGAYHMDHVRTQHTYSIPTLFSTAIAFLAAGYLVSYSVNMGSIISLGIGLTLNFLILFLLNKYKK